MMAEDDFDELEGEELGEYVPALFARTPTEAEKYLQLLEDYGIPARVDEEFLPPKGRRLAAAGVAVLVPETLLEDAKGFLDDLSDDELKAADEEDDDLEEDEEEEDEEEEEDDDDEGELGLFSEEDELEEDEEEEDEDDDEEEDEEEDEKDEDVLGEDGLDGPETDHDLGKG